MKVLLTMMVAVTLAMAGCTNSMQDLKDHNEHMKDFEYDEGQAGDCDKSTARFQDIRTSTLSCPELSGAAEHRLELGPCNPDETETTVGISLSGSVKAGSLQVTVKGDDEVLLEETYTSDDGDFYGGVGEPGAHSRYTAEVASSNDFGGEVNVFLTCEAA